MSLLSVAERDRLIHRPHDAKKRASNDVRIRKKLRSWLENLDDIALIDEYLPQDQVIKEIADNHIYFLMGIARKFMEILKYYPIIGKADHPESWKVLITQGVERPATDIDMSRALSIKKSIEDLMALHGESNPIDKVLLLSRMDSHPELQDKITEAERRGLERLTEAIMDYDPRHQRLRLTKIPPSEPK